MAAPPCPAMQPKNGVLVLCASVSHKRWHRFNYPLSPPVCLLCRVMVWASSCPQVMTEVPQDEVELSLLKTGLGSVTQSDVEAAALAEASIFAFNVGGVPADVKVGRA